MAGERGWPGRIPPSPLFQRGEKEWSAEGGSLGFNGPRRFTILLLLFVFTAIVPAVLLSPAHAHPVGVSSGTISLDSAPPQLLIRINADEWMVITGQALPIPFPARDGEPYPIPEADQRKIAEKLASSLSVSFAGDACRPALARASIVKTLDQFEGVFLLSLDCPKSEGSLDYRFSLFPRNLPGATHILQVRKGEEAAERTLTAAAPSVRVSPAALGGWWIVVRDFLGMGIHHIFSGYDHILFLLGIALGASRFVDLVKWITAFTAAHTMTFFLVALNVVSVSPRIVEPLIALSICYIALEDTVIRRVWTKHILIFGFGLVHGMGFASILGGVDLPRANLFASVISFNLGVEAGQMAILLLVVPLLAVSKRVFKAERVVVAASVLLFLAGGAWFVERVFF